MTSLYDEKKSNDHLITDEGDLKKYYTQIPHYVDDLELSLIAFRLYFHLKRIAGDSGACYQSTETLSKSCNMSAGSVSKAKKELIKFKLIKIATLMNNGKAYHEVAILDIWAKNISKYSELYATKNNIHPSLGEGTTAPNVIHPSLGEPDPSPRETNKNIINNNIKSTAVAKIATAVADTDNQVPQEQAAPETVEPKEKPAKRKDLHPIAVALAQVTGMDLAKNGPRLHNAAKKYAFEEIEDILGIYGAGGAWYREDWRGKQGEKPNLGSILATWGQYKSPDSPREKETIRVNYPDCPEEEIVEV